MEKEKETIHGFDIEKRELTEEEATRPITLERFTEFHHAAGEDFVDQCESIVNHLIWIGWCLHKYPEKSKDFLKVANHKYGGVQMTMELFENEDGEDDAFYTDFAEFLNQTESAKKRVNQILIQVTEYYNQ